MDTLLFPTSGVEIWLWLPLLAAFVVSFFGAMGANPISGFTGSGKYSGRMGSGPPCPGQDGPDFRYPFTDRHGVGDLDHQADRTRPSYRHLRHIGALDAADRHLG